MGWYDGETKLYNYRIIRRYKNKEIIDYMEWNRNTTNILIKLHKQNIFEIRRNRIWTFYLMHRIVKINRKL